MEKIKQFAKKNNVPIIQDETALYLEKIIKEEKIKKILEIGSAIGYSAIKMALISKDIKIITIEKNEKLYNIALENIKEKNLAGQIQIILGDAKEVLLNQKFDLIFIDGAKSSNKIFFEKFQNNLKKKGLIVTDNIYFHGLLNSEIKNRNLKQLVKKINKYKAFLKDNAQFDTKILNIGDGISVSRRKDENTINAW